MSQIEIGIKYNVSQRVVWRAMKRMGIPARKAVKRNQWRENNTSWKGGRVLQATKPRQRGERTSFGNGYYYILDPQHPNAGKDGYVGEHIVIACQARGTCIKSGEIVHHINLNKHDNRPENLVITNRTIHANWHNQLEEIAVKFMNDGLIGFSPFGGYELK
jgi:hypothetical protein